MPMHHVLCSFLVTFLLLQASAADAGAPQSGAVTTWMSYSGPVADVRVVLVRRSGLGVPSTDSLVIEGSGVARHATTTRAAGGGEPRRLMREASITIEEFAALLSEFYAERFFQLDESYQLGARFVAPLSGGMASISQSTLVHSGSEELAVRLGSYEKRVTLMPREEFCPSYLLKLRNSVIAFSRAHGIYE